MFKGEIRGADSAEGRYEIHEGKNVKGKNKGLTEKTKGTRAKEKKQRLRGEMKGAGSAKGEN